MRLWESSVMNVIHRRFVRRTRKKNNKKMYITLVCQCTRGGSLAGKWSFMPQHWTHIAPFLSASLSVCHPQQLLPFVHNLHHSLVYCVYVCVRPASNISHKTSQLREQYPRCYSLLFLTHALILVLVAQRWLHYLCKYHAGWIHFHRHIEHFIPTWWRWMCGRALDSGRAVNICFRFGKIHVHFYRRQETSLWTIDCRSWHSNISSRRSCKMNAIFN